MRSVHWISMLALSMLSALCSGCGANFNSIHRSLNTSDGKGVLIDAKQRAIFVGERVDDDGHRQRIVCPEPSPDSLSAYAAEMAAKSDKLGVGFAGASQETAAMIGIRTSGIQALRDQISHTCLNYMNGIIDHDEYEVKSRRLQKHTIAYLAIEQLTGAVRAPAVVLNTGGTAETGRTLSEMNKEVTSLEAQIADLEKKKISDPGNAATYDSKIKSLADNKSAIEKGMENTRGLMVSGVTFSQLPNASAGATTISPSKEVVEAIQRIVEDIILVDDIPQVCLSRISSKKPVVDQFFSYCTTLFRQFEEFGAERLVREKVLSSLLQSPQLSVQEKRDLILKISGYADRATGTNGTTGAFGTRIGTKGDFGVPPVGALSGTYEMKNQGLKR